MMSDGDHESWDGEMVMSENNETPIPVVSYRYQKFSSGFC